MRLSVASSAAAERLSNERVTPGNTSDVTVKWSRSRLSTEMSTSNAAALITACAPGYEGSGVVLPTSGSHAGSLTVLGLSSVSAARIAVTGRHRLYVYLDRKSTRLNSSHSQISY